MNRRTFLKRSAVMAPLLITSKTFARPAESPNETVTVGIVGLGGRSKDIVATALGIPNMRIIAVCDCFGPRVDSAKKALMERGVACTGYLDLREMLEKEPIDGVMAITTTHARAWVCCQAMIAGKDIYIEKPMSLTIAEGRAMMECARHYGRVTQVGTQQRSIPLNNWASDLVKNGAIGKISTVLAPNFVGPLEWTPKPEEPLPDGGRPDWWDVWTSQAELRPYHSEIHRGWSQWSDYDGGGISFGVTGWGTHSLDQMQRGLGTDETGPVEILLEEPVAERRACPEPDRQPSDNETGAPYYGMVLNTVGPRAKVRMRYAQGTEVLLHCDGNNGPGLGCVFIGENGRIEINRDKVAVEPRELLNDPSNPGYLTVPESQPHIENWIECIKSRGRCTADIEYGHRSTTLCYLINIARRIGRVGEPLLWDPQAERFTNCDEANTFLARERRQGWELPALTT